MHVVIMGCGRVGATLARSLEDRDHTVAVIDTDADAFRRLGQAYSGITVTGYGFDRETLLEAGIDRADAFAAVSNGDNSNVIAARVARESFGVETVIARIYDPGRAEVYQRLGITTVATVRWTADQVLRRMLPAGNEPIFRDTSGTVRVDAHPAPEAFIGKPVAEYESANSGRMVWIERSGSTLIPGEDTVVQDGDILHIATKEA